MKQSADTLLRDLAPEIDRKCAALQRARRERLEARLFLLLCAMVVLLPALLVFAGVSLTLLLAPLAFLSLSMVLLLPILLSHADQGGMMHEQA